MVHCGWAGGLTGGCSQPFCCEVTAYKAAHEKEEKDPKKLKTEGPIFSHLKNLGMQLVYKINLVVSATKGFWLKDDFNRIFWNLEDDGKEIFDYCNYYLTFSYFFNYSSIDRSRCRGRAQAVDSAFVSRLQIFDVLGGLDGSQQFLVAKTTAMEKNHCPPGSFT